GRDGDVGVIPDFGVDVAEVITNFQLAARGQIDPNFIVGVGFCGREGYQKYKAEKDLLNLREHHQNLEGNNSKIRLYLCNPWPINHGLHGSKLGSDLQV